MAFSRSLASAYADMPMIGMFRVRGSFLRARTGSQRSMIGISRSIRITSGCSVTANLQPCSLSSAARTSKSPHRSRRVFNQNYVRVLGHGQLAALLAVLSCENLEIAASLKARLQHIEIIVVVFDVCHVADFRLVSRPLWLRCRRISSDHCLGRRTVNTEPLPGSLATVMSPPII